MRGVSRVRWARLASRAVFFCILSIALWQGDGWFLAGLGGGHSEEVRAGAMKGALASTASITVTRQ